MKERQGHVRISSILKPPAGHSSLHRMHEGQATKTSGHGAIDVPALKSAYVVSFSRMIREAKSRVRCRRRFLEPCSSLTLQKKLSSHFLEASPGPRKRDSVLSLDRTRTAKDFERSSKTCRSLRRHIQNFPIGIVAQSVKLNLDGRHVAMRGHPAKTPFTVSCRPQLCVMKGRPISVPNTTTRTNRHVQEHLSYPLE